MIAAMLSRELKRPVSMKLVQHAFHVMGWTMPQMTKKQLIGATHEKPKPTGINEDWESDITYIWCDIDRWCYLFIYVRFPLLSLLAFFRYCSPTGTYSAACRSLLSFEL